MKVLKIIGILSLIALIILAVNLFRIFEHDNYYPEKGSILYYIGISSLIRDAPIVQNTNEPLYYGSAGDGTKLPQSKIIYESNSKSPKDLENKIELFLNSNGFGEGHTDKNSWDLFNPEEKRLLTQIDYKSRSGEIASLLIYEIIKTKNLQIEITHYE